MTVRALAARWVIALYSLGLLAGCNSPVKPSLVEGTWTGLVRPSKTDTLAIRFSDQDGRLVGVACRWDYNTRVMTFNDMPVSIRGRTVTVGEFSGEFADSGPYRSFELHSNLDDRYVNLVRIGNYCGQD